MNKIFVIVLFVGLTVLGCDRTPDKVLITKAVPSIDDMFKSYQDEVYQECYRLDISNCLDYSIICVSHLRKGEGKFSCGNGISPRWYPFHRLHIPEEMVLNCIGAGETLVSCQSKFGNLHKATSTFIYDKCIKNYTDLSPCSVWQEVTGVVNEKLCDKCKDKCDNSTHLAACLDLCDTVAVCKDAPQFKTKDQCIEEMITIPCHNLVNNCSNVNSDLSPGEPCLTND